MKPPVELHLIDDDAIRQGATWSMGFGVYYVPHDSVTGDAELMDTSAMTARFKIREGDFDGDVAAEGDTANGRIVLGYTPSPVERSTAYVLGEQITADPFNGYRYRCTTAGTTSGSPVVLGTVVGGTTTDGTAVFTCLDTDVSNAYMMLTASYTEGLADWGRGVWDFELIDGSTVFRLFEGIARLSREVTY